MAFASPAYAIWDQLTVAPRGIVAGLVLLAGRCIRSYPARRACTDDWAFAVFAYAVAPRRLQSHHHFADPRDWHSDAGTGWVELAPRGGWGAPWTD
jgi:hypothetical protein